MPYMTIIRLKGDPDELFAHKREVMDPVMRRAGQEHGLVSHAYARTDGGTIIVNVWQSKEGSEAVTEDPDVQAARERIASIASGPPTFEHYELDDLQIPGVASA